jgi:hypothetical protein
VQDFYPKLDLLTVMPLRCRGFIDYKKEAQLQMTTSPPPSVKGSTSIPKQSKSKPKKRTPKNKRIKNMGQKSIMSFIGIGTPTKQSNSQSNCVVNTSTSPLKKDMKLEELQIPKQRNPIAEAETIVEKETTPKETKTTTCQHEDGIEYSQGDYENDEKASDSESDVSKMEESVDELPHTPNYDSDGDSFYGITKTEDTPLSPIVTINHGDDDLFDDEIIPTKTSEKKAPSSDSIKTALAQDSGLLLMQRIKAEQAVLEKEKKRSAEVERQIEEFKEQQMKKFQLEQKQGISFMNVDNYKFEENDEESRQINAMNSVVMGSDVKLDACRAAIETALSSRPCFVIHTMSRKLFTACLNTLARTTLRRCRSKASVSSDQDINAQIFNEIIVKYIGDEYQDNVTYYEAEDFILNVSIYDNHGLTMDMMLQVLENFGISTKEKQCEDILNEEERTRVLSRNFTAVSRILIQLIGHENFCNETQLLQLLKQSILMNCSDEINACTMVQQRLLWVVCEELSERTANSKDLLPKIAETIIEAILDGFYLIELTSKQNEEPVKHSFLYISEPAYQFITSTMHTLQAHLPNTFTRVWRVVNLHVLGLLLNMDSLTFKQLRNDAFIGSREEISDKTLLRPQYEDVVLKRPSINDHGAISSEPTLIPEILSTLHQQLRSISRKKQPTIEYFFAKISIINQAMNLFVKTFCMDYFIANHVWYDTVVSYEEVKRTESGPKKRGRDKNEILLLEQVRDQCEDLIQLLRDRKQFSQQATTVVSLITVVEEACVYLKKISDRKKRDNTVQKRKKQKSLNDFITNDYTCSDSDVDFY